MPYPVMKRMVFGAGTGTTEAVAVAVGVVNTSILENISVATISRVTPFLINLIFLLRI
jgi:hypothetical protein